MLFPVMVAVTHLESGIRVLGEEQFQLWRFIGVLGAESVISAQDEDFRDAEDATRFCIPPFSSYGKR